ncbi:MAG: hypothetical protein Q9163_006207 [Psora crenata]
MANTSAALLDLCSLSPNDTIVPGSNLTWAGAAAGAIHQLPGRFYLRPNNGGALLPWVWTILILLVHIPIVIIRVVRWETVQTWCLACTLFTIAVTALSYTSTEFRAAEVLTWTPLVLIIDAGSMTQVLFLVMDEFRLWPRLRAAIRSSRTTDQLCENPQEPGQAEEPKCEAPKEPVQASITEVVPLHNATGQLCENPQVPEAVPLRPDANPNHSKRDLPSLFTSKPLYIGLGSLLLLLTVCVLQILGLAHARHHWLRASATPPQASWCSRFFQPFPIAVLDGNCNIWPIDQASSYGGVGCILIPGTQQIAWLKGTVIGISLSLLLEALDVLILALVQSGKRWRGIKMRRPWCTMIAGLVVLGLTLVFGLVYGSMLPPGIAEKVWMVADEADGVVVYEARLGPPGLRGALIAWNDGVFEGWGSTYFGG